VAIFYFLRFETSLLVASYDSQGHGGSIRPRLHTGLILAGLQFSLYSLGSAPFLDKFYIVIEMCLPRCCIETAVLRLLIAYSFPREPVDRRCLAMNYSGSQASCHSINQSTFFAACFEVFIAVFIKIMTSYLVTPCSVVGTYRLIGGPDSIFKVEGGDSMNLRNVCVAS
jgi:hypothetical protein